ncbi:MAG: hypothetical protein KJ607_13475 [Bacteroidetes bacterium]|nr:hypothetical protein [Bacteroidota bacterium]
MKTKTIFTVLWVCVFSIAMGYMESAVVVYLRYLYYPDGFDFPMKTIDGIVAVTEIFRETATLIMLIGIGILAGKSAIQRFAYFILSFAVWDIFYYFFLKVLLAWPESLMTWDILFLIPVPWIGPVITPVICALLMILLALLIIYFVEKRGKARISAGECGLLISGSLVVILSWIYDFIKYALKDHSFTELFSYSDKDEVWQIAKNYLPGCFDWWVFIGGVLIIAGGIALFAGRNIKELKKI